MRINNWQSAITLWRCFAVLFSLMGAPAGMSDEAENYYVAQVEALVQGNCIVCHKSGGQADAGGADILFSGSASNNHQQFVSYTSGPAFSPAPPGASDPQPTRDRADQVLSKITGGSGHGGGQIFSAGSQQYQIFSSYMDLLVADETTPGTSPAVFRVALEEPVQEETHTGVGNLRGWAVATNGISKVEVFIDGAYAFDAPYGGNRGDVGGAFPDVEDSDKSGFSLAFNYSDLTAGPHTIRAVAHTTKGETKESSASFNVVKFDSNFISGAGAVSLAAGSCTVGGDEISVDNAQVADKFYNLVLKWRTSEQGFEIIEIR